ncbi:MAG TPA: cell division protein FtsZ, partial [Acidimicrobiia bacterium]|nr:cell division protein FtsZ [Acidimicrobiia bacterium]
DLGLHEVNEAAEIIAQSAHPDANIIFGTVVDDTLGDEVRVTVIAAGFDRFERSNRDSNSSLGLLESEQELSRNPDRTQALDLTALESEQEDEFDVPEFLK